MRPWTAGLPTARETTSPRAVAFHATLEPTSQNFVAESAGPGTAVGATDWSPHAVAAIASAAHANHLMVILFWDVMITPNGTRFSIRRRHQHRRRRDGRVPSEILRSCSESGPCSSHRRKREAGT